MEGTPPCCLRIQSNACPVTMAIHLVLRRFWYLTGIMTYHPRTTRGYDVVVRVLQTTIWPSTAHYQIETPFSRINTRKVELSRIRFTLDMYADTSIDSRYNGGYEQDKTGVTMIAYLLQAAESGTSVIRILTDDTDIFVLVLYWVWKMHLHSAVQMERWKGVVIYINATCFLLGSKCLQFPGMHAISGCDNVSCPFDKGKNSALNILKAG